MFSSEDSAIYIERAEMHEQLASATGDIPARKMHLAMAAEYRRKAGEAGAIQVPQAQNAQIMKLNVAVG